MIEIKHFVQGTGPESLFASIGHWLTNRAVLNELGGPVTSEAGDIWLVYMLDDQPQGFSLVRPLPDSVHIKHVYALSPKVRAALLKALLKLISEGLRVFTLQRGDDSLWSEHGFVFKKRAGSQYGTWERNA
jgi:hypothetical protein